MKYFFVSLLMLGAVALSTQQEAAAKPARPIAISVPRPRPTKPPVILPDNKFSVVAPNTIRAGKDYYVYVRGLDIRSSIDITITLASDDNTFSIVRPVRLSRSTRRVNFKFDTSDLPRAANSFTLTVTSGTYSDSKFVTFVKKENLIFVQTNKGIFKPSELIQFRVFSIDSESNAIDPAGPVVITLTDPRNNEIGKFDNITFDNGKFEGQWLLSSKPILGTWTLRVQNGENDDFPVIKTIIVNEYILSPFTASLSVPSQVSFASNQIPVTINAEYTFKQPISGVATITITKNDGSTFTRNVSCSDTSTTFIVNLARDLGYTSGSYYFPQISLVFIDPKTNTKATDQAQVSILPYTYTLEFINDKIYRPGSSLSYTIVAKSLDGKPAANLQVTVTISNNYKVTLTTASDGTATGRYRTPSANATYLSLQATGKDCIDTYSYANPLGNRQSSEGIFLNLLTENPSFEDKVDIFASFGEDVELFYYFVTSKGVLLESYTVYFDDDGDPDYNPRTVEFSIWPDFTYAPSMIVYAYYFRRSDSKFFSASLPIQFKQELPNYLNLNLRRADRSGNVVVRPGSNITLTIDTKPGSSVSLSAIDQRVLSLARNQNFTISEVIDSFSQFTGGYRGGRRGRIRPFNYDPYGASSANLNFFTNIPRDDPIYYERPSAPREDAPDRAAGKRSDSAGPRVRMDFREVFLYETVSVDDGSRIIRQVPDSITTYIVFGVSMNRYEGMGLPLTLPSTTVFLPFFIAMELPPSVKRNEVVTINVQVFNYLGSTQSANLTIANDARFEVVNPSANGWTVSRTQLSRTIRIADKQIFTANLVLRPRVIGAIDIRVTLRGSSAGDALVKPLNVIHEGIPRSITTSTLIAIESGKIPADTLLRCNLPASAFADGTTASATVIGDILGKALNNLDKLIVMPGGCGEQNMIGFVPNYAIYTYLAATNKLTATLKATLTQYLTAGYQNQLNYQRFDGSFSAFGNSDPNGSTWLTAYVVTYFKLASSYININSAIIQNALNFIINENQQKPDGSFVENGRVIHSDMQGAAGSGIALTAYVAISLSTIADTYPDAVAPLNKAILYLEQQLSTVTDAYSLAVIANALQITGSSSATTAFNSFFALSTNTTTQIYWTVPAPASSNFYGPRSLDIEVTGYGLQLLVARNVPLGTTIMVVDYLTSKSNSFGGYSSSQDTVVALIALSKFEIAYTLEQTNVNLQLTPDAGARFNAVVRGSTALTLQTFALNSTARQLSVRVNPGSTGVAIVSLTCNFFDDPSKTVPSYNFTYNFDGSCQWRLQVQICPRLISGTSSNMAIMEVRMPSGYYYYNAWWINDNSNSVVSKIETYESYTVVIFYLNSVSSKGSCVTFGAGKSFNIEGLRPGSVTINDYYDTSKQGSTSFQIPSSVQSAPCKMYY